MTDDEETLAAVPLCEKFPILGSYKNLMRMRARGEGPPHYLIGYVVKYKPSEVEKWIQEQRRPLPTQ